MPAPGEKKKRDLLQGTGRPPGLASIRFRARGGVYWDAKRKRDNTKQVPSEWLLAGERNQGVTAFPGEEIRSELEERSD